MADSADAVRRPTLERRMTFMGKSTRITDTDTNPSYPLGVTVFRGRLEKDAFCKVFTERILEDPAFIRMSCVVIENQTWKKIDVNAADQVTELNLQDIPLPEHPEEGVDPDDQRLAIFMGNEFMGFSLVNRIHTWTELDTSRPLWHMFLLQNYKGNNSCLVSKTHHCIGDGVSLALLFGKLCDKQQASPARAAYDDEKSDKPTLTRRGLLKKQLLQIWGLFLYALYWLVGIVMFQFKYAKNYLKSDPPTCLKRQLAGERNLGWTTPVDVTKIKAAGKVYRATVNDVALAAVAGALRTIFKEKNTNPAYLRYPIRAAVPINIRDPADYKAAEALRNLFGFIVTTSPIHIADPVKRLKYVNKEMRTIKATPESKLSSWLSLSLSNVPDWLLKKTMNFNSNYFSFVCSNVPGPSIQLYVAGVPIDFGCGFVPPPPGIGLGIAIWGYDNKVRVSVSADAATEIDPWHMAALIDQELEAIIFAAKADSVASAGDVKKAQ